MMFRRLSYLFFLIALSLSAYPGARPARAAALAPSQAAETIRKNLVQAQLNLAADPASARGLVQNAQEAYSQTLAEALRAQAPEAHQRAQDGFAQLAKALEQGEAAQFAAGRAQVWTSILAGSASVVEAAVQGGDGPAALTWLAVREFRTATRFSHPPADATLAVAGFIDGDVSAEEVSLAVKADLYDTYQSRLNEALRALPQAVADDFTHRQAELAALAEGYFQVLSTAYREQNGPVALAKAQEAFSGLRAAALASGDLAGPLEAVDRALAGFRAAPLSPAEQTRRAGKLLRFISLVSVEYGRGVAGGRVIHDFEIQEAISFLQAASTSFTDLEDLLAARDPQKTAQAEALRKKR